MTIPQIGGMYRGDRSRKQTLVDFGFRLPSALDNRPLNFEEWEQTIKQAVYVSATPGDWELKQSDGLVVEQLIRPTGLIDPEIEVRKAGTQVDDLLDEIRKRVEANERVLVTCLTKKMAEDLTDYYHDLGVRVRYLHCRHRDHRARRDHPRPAQRRFRCPGRDQPAARGSRSAGSFAGRDPRRRQRRIPALAALAHPDYRARRAPYQGQGHHVRRQDHRLDEVCDRRNLPPPRQAARLQ